jgi:hypothetical protein
LRHRRFAIPLPQSSPEPCPAKELACGLPLRDSLGRGRGSTAGYPPEPHPPPSMGSWAPILAGALPRHRARLRPPAMGFAKKGTGLHDRLPAGAAPTTVHGNLGAPPAPPAVAASPVLERGGMPVMGSCGNRKEGKRTKRFSV